MSQAKIPAAADKVAPHNVVMVLEASPHQPGKIFGDRFEGQRSGGKEAEIATEAATGPRVFPDLWVFHQLPQELLIAVEGAGKDVWHLLSDHFPEEGIQFRFGQMQEGDEQGKSFFLLGLRQEKRGKYRKHPCAVPLIIVLRGDDRVRQDFQHVRNHFRQPRPDLRQEFERVYLRRR